MPFLKSTETVDSFSAGYRLSSPHAAGAVAGLEISDLKPELQQLWQKQCFSVPLFPSSSVTRRTIADTPSTSWDVQ
jgi:hypothetical protein